VWATLSVDAQIPDPLRIGLFAAPATYKALIRFSNGRGPDDTKPEAHGMAIKVLVPEGDGPPRMQDFILADHPVFFAQNVQHAFEFLAATVKGVPVQDLVPKYPKLIGFTSVATQSLLAMSYWSQTPYKLGQGAVNIS
jgi:catalase